MASPLQALSHLSKRPMMANGPENIHELLISLFNRVDPDNKAQLFSLVIARNFPAAGSRDNNAGQHGGMRDKERVRHFVHHQGRSVPVEPSSCDL